MRKFLILSILFFVIPTTLLSYSNDLSFGPTLSTYFVQEPETKSGMFSYGGGTAFDFDLSNKFNLIVNFSVERPVVFGGSNEFNDQYFIFSGSFGVKYYPTALVETQYIQRKESDILVENRKSTILPYIGSVVVYSFFIDDSESEAFTNLTALGAAFIAGFDIPVSTTWGISIFSQATVSITPLSPFVTFMNYHMGVLSYFNF